jgi:hypothetical protein
MVDRGRTGEGTKEYTHAILRHILYLYITTIPTTIGLAEYPFIYI